MTELEVLKDVLRCSFWFHINLNDTFYYACADSEEIDAEDLEELMPIYQKYGFVTLIAYVAVMRGHDPQVKSTLTDDYWAAKKEIEPLAEKGSVLYERYYDRKEQLKQMSDFGGQTVSWSSFSDRFVNILNEPKSQYRRVMRIAKLQDGTFAVGGSTHETLTRLKRKYDRKSARISK